MNNNGDNGDRSVPAFDSMRLSHAYIAGGDMAEILAMAAVCSGGGARPCRSCLHCDKASRGLHPDIVRVDPLGSKRDISVDQIRELKKDAYLIPGEASMKAFIINADAASVASQNILLKILEEPPANTIFIMQTDNPATLLPTVRSRYIEMKARSAAGNEAAGCEAAGLKASEGEASGSEATSSKASEGEVSGSEATSNKAAEGETARSEAARSEAAEDDNADGAELVGRFFSAIERDNVQLISFMFQLEKLDKRKLAAFLSSARERAAALLIDSVSCGDIDARIPAAVLESAERALQRAEEYCYMNVSAGHISGMLCSSLMK